MPTDPYYNIENVMSTGAQNTALGRTSGMSPTALTSVVEANYADQANATRANQQFALQQETEQNQATQIANQGKYLSAETNATKDKAIASDVSGGISAVGSLYTGYKTLFPGKTTTPTTPTTPTQPETGQPGTTTPGDPGVGQEITPEASPQMTGATPGLAGEDPSVIQGVGEGAQMVSEGTEVGEGGGTLLGWFGELLGSDSWLGEVFMDMGDSVLCTELSHQGKLDKEVLRTEGIYVSRHVTKDEYSGYRIIADPLVKLMQRSKLFTQIIAPFIRAFAYEMAHRVNPEIQGSKLGSYILLYGIPICRFVYKLRDWRLSWQVSQVR